MPNGPKRKVPASRSSRLPKTLGASKRGTHSQSTAPSGATSAPVWQSDRNAYSAIGGKGDGVAALGRPEEAAAGVAPGAFALADGSSAVRDFRWLRVAMETSRPVLAIRPLPGGVGITRNG